ncbi:MAG: hypothetical protein AAF456_07020 [Planctomycetota bacterium]
MTPEADVPAKKTSMFAQCAILTGTYAFLGLVFSATMQAAPFAIVIVAALAVSTFQVAVCFSVLGPGPYWLRLLYSHGFAFAVLVGILTGVLLNVAGAGAGYSEVALVLAYGILFAFPASVAGQLPYWVCRGLGSWQLVPAGENPREGYSIRDLLILTIFCAIAVSAPTLVADISTNLLEPGTIQLPRSAGSADAVPTESEFNRQVQNLNFEVAAMVAAYAFGTSLLAGLPVTFLTFRPKQNQNGCMLIFGYIFGFCLITSLVISVVLGAPPYIEAAVFFWIFFCGAIVTLWMPLSMLRFAGFRLLTPARFEVEPEWDPDTASWPVGKEDSNGETTNTSENNSGQK